MPATKKKRSQPDRLTFYSTYIRFLVLNSSLKDLINENMIKIRMNAKGKAAIIDAVCRAFNPPDHSRINAAADTRIPHTIFVVFGGFKLPLVVCIPRTNVAESAEVIKNVLISKIANIDVKVLNGKCANTANKDTSLPWVLITSPRFTFMTRSKYMPEPPKMENHNVQKMVGTTKTPIINSRTVRPLETRAINVPTNGAQAIHQAQ